MLAPLSWLNRYARIELPVEEYAERMIMTGTEVEGWKKLGADIDGVVVGRIESLEKHPGADKLKVCQINAGSFGMVQIVTGADNVSVGDCVPVALHGSTLPGGVKIKKGKLRGVDSYGMLCSGEELKITEADFPGAGVYGILLLDKMIEPGTDIRKVIGLNDTVVEFKTLANRPDCMSMLGIARESAAVLDVDFNPPIISVRGSGGNIQDEVSVSVEAPDLCPRYTVRLVRNVRIAPSPAWMRDHLRAAGVRSINNIVDITNYVMLEMGQPMHAFDMRHVQGRKIVVRRAKEDETLVTLDGKRRALTGESLMICDAQTPVGLAGIMGGEYSEIIDDTTEILLESANFLGSNIRVTCRALGLRTEASARFEKGIDPTMTVDAVNRACQLIEALDAGDVVDGMIDICMVDLSERVVIAAPERICGLLGMDIPTGEMLSILNRLHIRSELSNGMLVCHVPGFRRDIEHTADLAEEVLRIYGYDRIPETLMTGTLMRGRRSQEQRDILKMRRLLCGMGLDETLSYSFISPRAFDQLLLPQDSPLRLAAPLLNPLGEDLSVMRTTMTHSMLEIIALNLSRQQKSVRIFEIGKVYRPKFLPITEQPEETKTLAIALCTGDSDFYTLKGMIETLLSSFGIVSECIPGGSPWLHPGRKARLLAGETVLGEFGQLHPDCAERYGIGECVLLAEISVPALLAVAVHARLFCALPKFPAVARDIAVVLSEEQTVGPVLQAIEKAGAPIIESVGVFDVYRGAQVGESKKSVAFSLSFRHAERTLTDQEVNEKFDKIVRVLAEQFGGEIRK